MKRALGWDHREEFCWFMSAALVPLFLALLALIDFEIEQLVTLASDVKMVLVPAVAQSQHDLVARRTEIGPGRTDGG